MRDDANEMRATMHEEAERMTTDAERPTVAVAITVEMQGIDEEGARQSAIRMGDALLAAYPMVVSVSSKPVPALAQREDAPDAASGSIQSHHEHMQECSVCTWWYCDHYACDCDTPTPKRPDDDEAEHRIGMLRDDADTLDRIAKRYQDEPGLTPPWSSVRATALQLDEQADRLERDSA
jgi:hypothetical protein